MVATGETEKTRAKLFYVIYGKHVMSVQMLEVILLGAETMLGLERDAWTMVKRLRQATNEMPISFIRAPLSPLSSRIVRTHLPHWHVSLCVSEEVDVDVVGDAGWPFEVHVVLPEPFHC